MKGLKYVILITHRELEGQYLDFFKSKNCARVISKFCRGTATDNLLNVLSLERTEKVMLQAFIRESDYKEIYHDLNTKTDLTYSGNGIAIFLETGAIGGESAKQYLVGDEPITVKEEKQMDKTNNYSLIVAIADKGNTDLIMDSARNAGATGGTVLKAKGTGTDKAKFFGVSISEEKEMVYIVCRRTERDAIMTAIMQNAGCNTQAHGVVFSLPVESVLGIKAFED